MLGGLTIHSPVANFL